MQKFYKSMDGDTTTLEIDSLNFGDNHGIRFEVDDPYVAEALGVLMSKEDSITMANDILKYWKKVDVNNFRDNLKETDKIEGFNKYKEALKKMTKEEIMEIEELLEDRRR